MLEMEVKKKRKGNDEKKTLMQKFTEKFYQNG